MKKYLKNKIIACKIGFISSVNIIYPYINEGKFMSRLPSDQEIQQFKEIAIQKNKSVELLLAKLSSQERIFAYFMLRASLPGNLIAADQLHRDSVEIISIFEAILKNKIKILNNAQSQLNSLDAERFLDQVETFLIYLWSSHGLYFAREHSQEKRTPQILGLDLITEANLIQILNLIEFENSEEILNRLKSSIFDNSKEHTATVPGSINLSSVNIYSPDFTDEDFEKLSFEEKTRLNAYFYIDNSSGSRIPKIRAHSTKDMYARELSVSSYWLNKAYNHAKAHPEYFDQHLVESLKYLIEYLESGDEELFKKHSVEWLKSNSNIDINFGFIETYKDPKSYRGIFQAEVTIKSLNIEALNKILPSIEAKLPFPQEFLRNGLSSGLATIPNASINTAIFGVGEFGPMKIVAAYCLPNYEELRSEFGSKQIIYEADKSLGEIINPKLNIILTHSRDKAEWILKNDPENQLSKDLWNIQCILHETIGHASGKLAFHTFKEGENLMVDGKKYSVGETIAVTNKNLGDFLAGYEQTLEELRAEIIALYVSVNFIDELQNSGILGNWLSKMSKDELKEWFILNMASAGLRRLTQQNENADIIAGDHARANQVIMNFLCDNRGLVVSDETVIENGNEHTVIACRVIDMQKALTGIEELMILVQTIKSTGNSTLVKDLVQNYGIKINSRHFEIMHKNKKILTGELKACSLIYPTMIPIIDEKNQIVDIEINWSKNFQEQQLYFSEISLSRELIA